MDGIPSWRRPPHVCEDGFDQDANECHPSFPLWINLVQCVILLLMSTAVLQCVCQLLCIPFTASTASSSPNPSLTRPLASPQRMLSMDEMDEMILETKDGDEKPDSGTKEDDDAPPPYTEVIQGPEPP